MNHRAAFQDVAQLVRVAEVEGGLGAGAKVGYLHVFDCRIFVLLLEDKTS